jgi:CRISPR-associated protein Csx17
MRNEIHLAGCSPSPLNRYLKGLGILRLATRFDPSARAAWDTDGYVLRTVLDEASLERHFLEDYEPSPVVAPWNGGSGFFEKDSKDALLAIQSGHGGRFAAYRATLIAAEASLQGFDRGQSPKEADKQRLLTAVRANFPDEALDWLDAALLLTQDGPKFPPLLGTGGNDGRLDFTNNFMQRLVDVMDPNDGAPTEPAAAWLEMALYDRPAPRLIKKAIGQFAPGQVGGPNSSTGYSEKGVINPWDFILMIEGALAFAATAARKHAHETGGSLAYPFTVRTTAAGAGALGSDDASSARAELWMPIWDGFASYGELRALLSEGRVALGRRPARDALDFIRAINRLGSYRGVESFQRYGLLMRSGKAFLATPLQRVRVTNRSESRWIDELDRSGWLDSFRDFSAGENTPRRFHLLRRRLEDVLFELCERGQSPARMQAILMLLGSLQHALSHSSKGMEHVSPTPLLQERWAIAADDGSCAYRIARSLASLDGDGKVSLPLRCHLYPMHPNPRIRRWIDQAGDDTRARQHPAHAIRLTVPKGSSLVDQLIAILERRLWLENRLGLEDKPLSGGIGVSAEDWLNFLLDASMDRKIQSLMFGLSLVGEHTPQVLANSSSNEPLPAAAGLLKLCATSNRMLREFTPLGPDQSVPMLPGLGRQLASGAPAQSRRAIDSARRRLHSSGLPTIFPKHNQPDLGGIDPRRLAAALLIPLNFHATAVQARHLFKQTPESRSQIEAGSPTNLATEQSI